PEVANFALFEAKFLPGLPDDSERLADLLLASVDAALDGSGTGRNPFDIGSRPFEPPLEIASVPCLDPPAHGLDVLLRHRLLREPGGFEGIGVRGVGSDPPHESRFKLDNCPNRRIEGCSAQLGRAGLTTEQDNPLITGGYHAFGRESGVRGDFVDAL